MQKPIKLGNFMHGEGEMGWAWWHENHSELAIIGSTQTDRKALTRSLRELMASSDSVDVYSITAAAPSMGGVHSVDAIPWVEEFSDPPEIFNDRESFINNRQFFSNAYFNLYSKIIGVDRKDMIPSIRFKPHLGGPLVGYYEAIESLAEDVSYKLVLKNAFDEIKYINWVELKNGEKHIYLNPQNTIYEQALSLLKGVWSFFCYTCKTEDAKQIAYYVELPRSFFSPGVDPMVTDIMIECLRILKEIAITTTTTIIVSSDYLFPIPELHFRFKLLFLTEDSDINIVDDPNADMLIDSTLLAEWRNQNPSAALWMDDYTSDINSARIPVLISPSGVEFWKEDDDTYFNTDGNLV